jgi:3-dehydroquinate synthase
MSIRRISVRSSAGTYTVVCGAGALSTAGKMIAALGRFTSTHVLSSPRVWRAVGKKTMRGLGTALRPRLHFFDDAEASKNLRTVEEVARSLTRAGADRRSLLVAVGGGVVGDVAGFVAASYLRGVALVHVPTTLVAQTDSSIGGKTGVNIPEGKNLIGAFYPAKLVLTDPLMLRTLPPREFRGGMAEVIKYGIIADTRLFAFLERNLEKALARDPEILSHLIMSCVEIKATVVSKDERESGLREILNFGHTFGHALESVTRYSRYQHGEAVAWGMMAAALLGHEIGLTPAEDACRIVALVRRLGALPPWPSVSPAKLIATMRSDKKSRGGNLRFVLSPKIGKAITQDDVPIPTLKSVLHFAPRLRGCCAATHD